jgi:hypothetical protein
MALFGKKARKEDEKPGNRSCEAGLLFFVEAPLFLRKFKLFYPFRRSAASC